MHVFIHCFWAFPCDIDSVLQTAIWVLQAQSSSWYTLPEKHFPWVWQLEQNKRLLFASCRSQVTTHSWQHVALWFTAKSWECLRSEKWIWRPLLFTHFVNIIESRMSQRAVFSLGSQVEKHTSLNLLALSVSPFQNNLSELQEDAVSAVLIIM